MATMDVAEAAAEAAADRKYCADQMASRLKAKGWKQTDLRAKTGLSKQSLSQYFAATAMPSSGALQKIAKAFDCRVAVFIRPEERESCEVLESPVAGHKIFVCRVLLPAPMAHELALRIAVHQAEEKRTRGQPPSAEGAAVAAASNQEQPSRARRASAKT